MKIACQHLLCRRDLSCTKVNAVNRLSNVCTLASDCQRRGCSWATAPGSPREGRAESCWQQAAAGAGSSAGTDKQTQLFKLVRVWGHKPSQLKKRATKPPSGSAIFPCCISVLLYHIHSRQLVWKEIASPHSRIINLLRTHGGQP